MTELADPAVAHSTRDDSQPFQLPPASVKISHDLTSAPARTSRRRWRSVGWVAALLVLIAVAAGAWWVGASSQSPEQAAARADEPTPSWVTAPVEFRVLSSTLVTRGDVRPDTTTNIGTPTSVEGDAVVTQNVVNPGDAVSEGDRVVEVSGRPVFVMQGDAAIYRTLSPGMEGDDVAALQISLKRLGYSIDSSGVFDEQTKTAVASFYDDAGYDPIATSTTFSAELATADAAVTDAETGVTTTHTELEGADDGPAASEIATADATVDAAVNTLEDARATRTETVDAADWAVKVAEASRTEIHATSGITVDEYNAANTNVHNAAIALADAVRDNDAAVESAEDQLGIAVLTRGELDETVDTATLQSAVDTAETALADAQDARAELLRVNGPTVPQGEIVFVTITPTRVLTTGSLNQPDNPEGSDTPESPSGDQALVSLASGDLIVTASVRPDEVELVNEGLEVDLLDELTDTTYPATVTNVASEATTNTSGQLAHEITISTDTSLPDDLVGNNLRVTLTSASTDIAQLVVPVAAVTASADGQTRVSILDPTGTPTEIEITAGLSADGFVAIEPINDNALDSDSAVIVGR